MNDRPDDVNWEKIAFDAKLSRSDSRQYTAAALLALENEQNRFRAELENMRDREGFNVRLEALKAAREHVSSLPSEQRNERGYRDHAMKPNERTSLELQVARYLLEG